MCGEHAASKRSPRRFRGSSPRVRGTRGLELRAARGRGIIPACAGNTCTTARTGATRRDHPRVCGEHSAGISATQKALGSSPRVRGTLGRHSRVRDVRGIIPACAGNTGSHSLARARTWDHPRACGEHFFQFIFVTSPTGSSPRVRGTLADAPGIGADDGIIPACAGNTLYLRQFAESRLDHPRVCGEHFYSIAVGTKVKGSSPRVRGTPVNVGTVADIVGIIPACAGNTREGPSLQVPRWDHPRVCGEHEGGHTMSDNATGSSPRVRGTL